MCTTYILVCKLGPLCWTQNTEIIDILIDNGADIYAKTPQGRTVLHHASTATKARCLIRRGADLSAQDKEGKTSLDFATELAAQSLAIYSRGGMKYVKGPIDELVEFLKPLQTYSKFLAKLSEFSDDMHPAMVLEQLGPLISNISDLQLYYTATSVAYKQGRINEVERNKFIKKGLRVAVGRAVNSDNMKVFKLALQDALKNNYISRAEQLAFNHDAEMRWANEPLFVEDMKRCIVMNAKSIVCMNAKKLIVDDKNTGKDMCDPINTREKAIIFNNNAIKATSDALRTFQNTYKQRRRFEYTVDFLKCVLNAFSMGVGSYIAALGTYIAEELTCAFSTIIDFSCTSDILQIVNSARAKLHQPPFDPKAFLNSDDGKDFVKSPFFYGATDVDGSVLSCEIEKRGINALEALAVAAEASSVTSFETTPTPQASTPISAPNAMPMPPPPPESTNARTTMPSSPQSAGSPTGSPAPQSLSEFLQTHSLEKVEEELLKNDFRTVRALKKFAAGECCVPGFSAHVRKEGVNLSGGQFSELYASLMDP